MTKEEFWQLVYAVAIQSTQSNERAKTLADNAALDWDEFLLKSDFTGVDD